MGGICILHTDIHTVISMNMFVRWYLIERELDHSDLAPFFSGLNWG
jgi:hypothetical protein